MGFDADLIEIELIFSNYHNKLWAHRLVHSSTFFSLLGRVWKEERKDKKKKKKIPSLTARISSFFFLFFSLSIWGQINLIDFSRSHTFVKYHLTSLILLEPA